MTWTNILHLSVGLSVGVTLSAIICIVGMYARHCRAETEKQEAVREVYEETTAELDYIEHRVNELIERNRNESESNT